ncbi:unnamed protein product [Bemisia tabaci]|uniref:Uncharacterized protein n=1 Tax=Bemisia tabaci TaxID=7038 RepID=A0A9P0ALY6_BEMTA|nr:unnamed protein product [Bemisia tabaci]
MMRHKMRIRWCRLRQKTSRGRKISALSSENCFSTQEIKKRLMQVYRLPELRLWPDKSAKLYAIRRFLGGSATSRIRGKLLVAFTTIIVLFALIVSLWSRRQEPVGRHNNALGDPVSATRVVREIRIRGYHAPREVRRERTEWGRDLRKPCLSIPQGCRAMSLNLLNTPCRKILSRPDAFPAVLRKNAV